MRKIKEKGHWFLVFMDEGSFSKTMTIHKECGISTKNIIKKKNFIKRKIANTIIYILSKMVKIT
jgi:predicted XRE-type DNA-binding protein